MIDPAIQRTSAWSRQALPSARRWFAIPLILALLGAAAGFTVGTRNGASAETLLLVRTQASDVTVAERNTSNAALALNTSATFAAAAALTGGDARNLQSRSTIGAVANSQIVSVRVTASTTEQAIAEADAVANVAVSVGQNQAPQELAKLTDSTRDLIASQALSNPSAERARVARLGDELGESQAAVIADANQFQLLQSAEASRQLPSSAVLGLIGALAGGSVGLAGALLLGVRRGAVRSARELSDLYPKATVINSADLAQVFGLEPNARTVFVAWTDSTGLPEVTETIRAALATSTSKSILLSESLTDAISAETRDAEISLITTRLSDVILQQVTHDQTAVLIIPIEPRLTKLALVDMFASRLPPRSYLLADNWVREWD